MLVSALILLDFRRDSMLLPELARIIALPDPNAAECRDNFIRFTWSFSHPTLTRI